MIYTFYSYKGGVGRTMALANVAELFYQSGLKVLMVDWDLEAPGLEGFFFSAKELQDTLDKPGLMDMILHYKAQMARELEADAPPELENLAQYMIDIYPNQTGSGKLFLLTAGRRSKSHFAAYAESVLTFNWQEFYDKWDGELYFEWLREQFENIADIILIDSRTGVTEMGGVCTYQMADAIVMLCAPNRQNLEGTYEMASNFTSPRVQDLRVDRPLNLLIIPARIDRVESEALDKFQAEFLYLFKDFMPLVEGFDIEQYWQLRIPYIPKYSFAETVAVRESGKASSDDLVISIYRLGRIMEATRTGQKLQDISFSVSNPRTAVVKTEASIYAENITTGLQIDRVNIVSTSYLDQVRADYLAYLHDSFHYQDFKGLMQVQQISRRTDLKDVYVPPKIKQFHLDTLEDGFGPVADRESDVTRISSSKSTASSQSTISVSVEEALKTYPAMVILGDPGSGKSTILKMLALTLSEQSDGPLPIILPLNAYARRLQQLGAVSLAEFLGEYYANRQQKLSRVDELFRQALVHGRTVVLLDGLDEVQFNRDHLISLLQDFVAEYIPQPADQTGKKLAITGNRVVVTSRIVGYNELPLTGRQWRVYTLTDFSRADIEQFIGQWTLAFARTTQGDTEPARQSAQKEQHALLLAIFSQPGVERLAANPLLLTILALIKYTGVVLPEQRVKLYELYLQALIESWNLARSLDRYPVGPGLSYEETVQVLAPLALWLRQENPSAGLISYSQLENWLTDYYHGPEWGLPKGEARQRGRDLLNSVYRYSNLLLERGEGQYGFLHLTLEEMLAAKSIANLTYDTLPEALALFEQYLLDPAWTETLQLAVGAIGVIQQRPKTAGAILQHLLTLTAPPEQAGQPVILAGATLLDVGQTGVGHLATLKVTEALVTVMQSATCPIRSRREAGNLLGRLGWMPDFQLDDLLLAPATYKLTGLDAFRLVEVFNPVRSTIWMGKYPVTNYQFARFIADSGYNTQQFWSDDGWAWRIENKRQQPAFWDDHPWNSPLYPVVGVTWFEANAYCRWFTARINESTNGESVKLPMMAEQRNIWDQVQSSIVNHQSEIRLPTEAEWEAAVGGRGNYPWGETFDFTYLNCADSWYNRDLSDFEEWRKWLKSESYRESGLTAVTTYPQGVSQAGVWDGCGNVWEWMINDYVEKSYEKTVRGGSWSFNLGDAYVSTRGNLHPGNFIISVGFRVTMAAVFV